MGLSDLIDESKEDEQNNTSNIDTKHHRDRAYNPHPKEEDFWEMFEELEERFPEDIPCDFIEVSGKMTKHHAKAYKNQNGTVYIRFSKRYVERSSDDKLKKTLLHEMVHLYTYKKGYAGQVSDGSHMFKWLCGAVGAEINQVNENSMEWDQLAGPFLEE